MYTEEDLLPLSALQHMVFCPRQCALIHVERIWLDNRLTAEGHLMHRRVHEAGRRKTGEVHTVRSLQLHSLTLGVVGIADAVEFQPADDGEGHRPATRVPGLPGHWLVVPVEYKRGRPKKIDCDRVQLCAQGICLEEMLDCQIPGGALFYGRIRRRESIGFDQQLRDLTRHIALRLHEMIRSGVTPSPEPSKKCERCSLVEACLPQRVAKPGAGAFLQRLTSPGTSDLSM